MMMMHNYEKINVIMRKNLWLFIHRCRNFRATRVNILAKSSNSFPFLKKNMLMSSLLFHANIRGNIYDILQAKKLGRNLSKTGKISKNHTYSDRLLLFLFN